MTQGSIKPAAAPKTRSSAFPRGGDNDARLLIIDDNRLNVVLMEAVFRRAGFQTVFTEMDSRLVRGRLPEIDPKLIILDLHMPYLDGFQVLDQIRQFASSEILPVMIVTADTTRKASVRAYDSGAQDVVIKPFSPKDIIVRAMDLLRPPE
jgi:putative two-component system response regulator